MLRVDLVGVLCNYWTDDCISQTRTHPLTLPDMWDEKYSEVFEVGTAFENLAVG